MSGVSEHVSQWAAGEDVSDCALGGPLPSANGAVPTLVIAQASISCDNETRNYKGVVFYGHDPVAWCCLLSEEISSFTDWGNTKFPGAKIVTIPNPVPSINCPPPNPKAVLTPREQMRNALRVLAPTWLVKLVPAKPAA